MLFLELNWHIYLERNEYGVTHNFQVLDEKQFQYIFELAEENLKMPVWKYNDKSYFKMKGKNNIDYRIGLSNETPEGQIESCSFTKDMPYIMGLTF